MRKSILAPPILVESKNFFDKKNTQLYIGNNNLETNKESAPKKLSRLCTFNVCKEDSLTSWKDTVLQVGAKDTAAEFGSGFNTKAACPADLASEVWQTRYGSLGRVSGDLANQVEPLRVNTTSEIVLRVLSDFFGSGSRSGYFGPGSLSSFGF